MRRNDLASARFGYLCKNSKPMQFRQALPADAARIMEIIRQAQIRMQTAGSAQWQDGYPALADIRADLACGRGLVVCIPAGEEKRHVPGAYCPQTNGRGIGTRGESTHGKSENGYTARMKGANGTAGANRTGKHSQPIETEAANGMPESAAYREETAPMTAANERRIDRTPDTARTLQNSCGILLRNATEAQQARFLANERAAIESGDRIVAYAAVVFDGEPAYDALEGTWRGGPDYGAVHRLAVADEALHKGIGKAVLCEAMRMARTRGLRSFRIDTARENHPMQRLLAALGFACRGTVHYASGERIAFEKQLNDETL